MHAAVIPTQPFIQFKEIALTLLTNEDFRQLPKNGRTDQRDQDNASVVKLFHPGSNCFWLLSEIDSEDHDRAFGLCDLGMGEPELGYVSVSDLEAIDFGIGWKIERDFYFIGEFPMSVYALAASWKGWITDDKFVLLNAQQVLRAKRNPANEPKPS